LSQVQADAPPVMLVALYPLADRWALADPISAATPLALPLRSRYPPLAVLHCCFRI